MGRPKKAIHRGKISISLDPESRSKLEALALADGTSCSAIVEDLILREYKKREKRDKTLREIEASQPLPGQVSM